MWAGRSKLDGICVCFALSTRCINQTTGMAWTEWKMHALMGGASIGEIKGKNCFTTLGTYTQLHKT